MNKSESYRGTQDPVTPIATDRTSTTYFFGAKGDEIADYSYNYKLSGTGAGSEIKTTSVMFYGNKRADALSAAEQLASAMNKSESYRGTQDPLALVATDRTSTTYFFGSKGDEIADYSYNYKLSGAGAGVDVKTTSVMFYTDKRAADLTAAEQLSSAMNKSESYRGTQDPTALVATDRTSTTYFFGSKGDEIADYSYNYKLSGTDAGTEVKTTSIMFYGDKRAQDLTAAEQLSSAMNKSESYRLTQDPAAPITTDRTSTTYFFGAKGDEIADYSYNYKLSGAGAGVDVKTTSVMYYSDKRASDLTASEQLGSAMNKSESYRGIQVPTALVPEDRTSTTFFFGSKGDEIADYSYNYKLSGTGAGIDVKTTSIMFYGNERAQDLTADKQLSAAMNKSESYRGTQDPVTPIATDRTSTTYFFGAKGDEIADYSYNYKLSGTGAGSEIKTTSVMFYGNKRADALSAAEQLASAMNKSESYRGTQDPLALVATDRTSTTYFFGSKGDEIADYSYNYKLSGAGAGVDVKTTSVMFYTDKRAADLTAAEQLSSAMNKSESYRGTQDPTALVATDRTSTTYFFGSKGDEIADYSYNYKLSGTDAGTEVKTTSIMFYGDKRAQDLTAAEQLSSAMNKSESYRLTQDPAAPITTDRTSTTYFFGAKGDEIADYSYNYKLSGAGAGVDVKTTSVMYYSDKRASDLTASEQLGSAMNKSESYRGIQVPTALVPEDRTSTTFFFGSKGDEIADYSYNYKLSGTGAGIDVKTTSIMFYGNERART